MIRANYSRTDWIGAIVLMPLKCHCARCHAVGCRFDGLLSLFMWKQRDYSQTVRFSVSLESSQRVVFHNAERRSFWTFSSPSVDWSAERPRWTSWWTAHDGQKTRTCILKLSHKPRRLVWFIQFSVSSPKEARGTVVLHVLLKWALGSLIFVNVCNSEEFLCYQMYFWSL